MRVRPITKLLFSLTLLGFTFTGCYYDVEEELYPPNTGGSGCDTAVVSYSNFIVPVFQDNGCISCHSTDVASGGVILDTHAGVQQASQSGMLVGAISHAPGFSPMPRGGNKLPDCTISKIRAWVNRGAQNN